MVLFSLICIVTAWCSGGFQLGSSSTDNLSTKKLSTIQELQNGFDRLFPQPVGLIMNTGEVLPFSIQNLDTEADMSWSLYNSLYDMFGSALFQPRDESMFKQPSITYESVTFFESFPETSILPAEVISKSTDGTYVLRILVDKHTEKNIKLDENKYMELEEEGEIPFSLLPKEARNEFSDIDLPTDTIVALVTEEDKAMEENTPHSYNFDYNSYEDSINNDKYLIPDVSKRQMYGYREAAGYPLTKKFSHMKSTKKGLVYKKNQKYKPMKKISVNLLKKRKQ